MELKKYSKDGNLSYSLGAFPTYELLKSYAKNVEYILLHEKLETSKDIEKILSLAKKHNIKIIIKEK